MDEEQKKIPTPEPVRMIKELREQVRGLTQQPEDLSILSYLVREVDCGRQEMPQARKAVGEWFHKQDIAAIREPGKARMRRLKQITDALYEEFYSLLGSQG